MTTEQLALLQLLANLDEEFGYYDELMEEANIEPTKHMRKVAREFLDEENEGWWS